MQKTQNIRIEDFNYPLPDERIAKFPLSKRDDSKLLVYRKGEIEEHRFHELPKVLPADSLLVFNNTRVIQARLHFRKETGALIEVFCLEPLEPHEYSLSFQSTGSCSWLCLVGNLKKWKNGVLTQSVNIDGKTVNFCAERGLPHGNAHEVHFSWDDSDVTFATLLDHAGELPIPPYLNRETEESDKTTYQTVYSKMEGSVAAPTAGLHFTPEVLNKLKEKNIPTLELTLHVGAGTFKPVKSETLEGHEMHTEYISVNRNLIDELSRTDRRVIAVGTTSVRTLESLYYIGKMLEHDPNILPESLTVGQWQPYDGSEEIDSTIAPQHRLISRPPEYGPIGNCHPDYHCTGIPLSHRAGNDHQFPSTTEYFTIVSLGIRKRTMARNIRLCTESRFQVSQLRRQFAITAISLFHRVQTQ